MPHIEDRFAELLQTMSQPLAEVEQETRRCDCWAIRRARPCGRHRSALRARYAGKRTATIGSGVSAFTALASLADLVCPRTSAHASLTHGPENESAPEPAEADTDAA
ncbi:hypothetical protein GCM10023080_062080 [Streptomyces pseudoechinosporeus]